MAKVYKVRDKQTGQVIDVPEEKLSDYGLTSPSTINQPTFQGGSPAFDQTPNFDELIKKYFPQDQWENAKKVMMDESGGNPAAVGDNYPIAGQTIPSYGLFQIRALPGRPDPTILTNP